jgi:hypothetical protein
MKRTARMLGVVSLVMVGGLVAVLFGGLGARRDLELLDPDFRRRAVPLLDEAARQAEVTYVVRETARPAWRQDLFYQTSRLPLVRFTRVDSRQSCHVRKPGWIGARAVDVTPSGPPAAVTAFYRHLKQHARSRGLRSGAGFGVTDAETLGWDPGHLERSGCVR